MVKQNNKYKRTIKKKTNSRRNKMTQTEYYKFIEKTAWLHQQSPWAKLLGPAAFCSGSP